MTAVMIQAIKKHSDDDKRPLLLEVMVLFELIIMVV